MSVIARMIERLTRSLAAYLRGFIAFPAFGEDTADD